LRPLSIASRLEPPIGAAGPWPGRWGVSPDTVNRIWRAPEHAIVLCVDEKSQIQALDRIQPGLPLKKDRCGTMTHDYKRHGTALFAALNLLEGTVIGQVHLRHRHQEFLRFLARLERDFAKELELHLILDNYGTHTHAKVKGWLAKHRRFQLHFIPTGSSWPNLIDGGSPSSPTGPSAGVPSLALESWPQPSTAF
jgi:DDE superfamily endonuclease